MRMMMMRVFDEMMKRRVRRIFGMREWWTMRL